MVISKKGVTFAIERSKYGLPKNSVILAEQIRTIEKKRLVVDEDTIQALRYLKEKRD